MRAELSDPEVAAAYLNAAFEDGTPELILAALSTIKKVYGDKQFPVRLTAQLPHTRRVAPKTRLLRAAPKPHRAAPKRTRKVAA
jgi:hypothetical protein